ncbi:S-adenosyl-L-methionine-dependent methyltransferase [Mariannaea sp. PMI_226]|nr:S-adenosyl-L-methionine-dependent methyltransferase [Mariannaea sp. PMI_226]
MSSSILDYRRENGRTYHRYKDGKYYLPNDELENERLDLQHHLYFLTFENKLGFAPPNNRNSNVKRVLDLGTGTGIWAIDYADEHPEAKVIGVDLSPIQPNFVPPNVEFIIDDIDVEWNYNIPFDYIHSRMMNSCVKDWKVYLQKIFDNLTPGGYLEVQEIDAGFQSDDGTLTEEHDLARWWSLLSDACAKLGQPFQTCDRIKEIMIEVGFIGIVDARFKWPTNRWPKDQKYKELGTWNNSNTNTVLESATLAPFTRVHGWTKEEVQVFLTGARKDLNNPKIHAYWPIRAIYGQKP